ncbi:undecaprenyl diphosphate synthase family protein [Trichomonas vaginalis G3]|uniref:Alkyl transferase n=1 Tax=Trichomonas vaginalis (strain ATCC PRA-98 / G3) TaxID=412133 RepID=A2EKJ5_TRIV3|nr:polyprenol biosynthetic process [Trichomonas vaginalis G3]EAY06822.1 undecaprenyl diphosphate synthase family protein [Trichomonas vaginalis G3]KAI5535438.1 polyprenol biosynthetic process [Trichomonas vaginalis G3]|eukprot:XP_001319045.1 undecaprenyl diphosphate synthase family protein [Trichomonas vaginalis G3]
MQWYHKALLRIIDAGEIPRHVAIVMDGNRRYARKEHLESITMGHKMGADKLKEVIEWFSKLNGIEMLSVYAFSILNFQRAQQEVNGLMDLAESTFKELADNPEFFTKNNCKINFIGRIEMLEQRVIDQINRVNQLGPKNPKFILNICVCYTSHDEIEHSRDECIENQFEPNYENVFKHLQLPMKVDLLIRTSGVMRMSNYLLLQCSDANIIVTDKLWPELSIWDLSFILIKHQLRNYLPE